LKEIEEPFEKDQIGRYVAIHITGLTY
jgi:hypothetical protein